MKAGELQVEIKEHIQIQALTKQYIQHGISKTLNRPDFLDDHFLFHHPFLIKEICMETNSWNDQGT